jgi:anti-sigma factor RsiW
MKHVQDKIQAYLDGELLEVEAAGVRDHCQSCPECSRILSETEAVWEAVAATPAPRLGKTVWPALENRLLGRRLEQWRGRSQDRPQGLLQGGYKYSFAGIAVGVVAVGLGLGLWLGQSPADESGELGWNSLLEEGALLIEGSDWTLDQVYLAAGNEEEGDPP